MIADPGNSPIRKRFVMASGSPRRQELVAALAPAPEIRVPGGEEAAPLAGEQPEAYVRRLSLAKARSVADDGEAAVVLAADTVVVLDGRILGKPADPAEARRMLEALRGRTHRVLTGVTALDAASGQWLSRATSSDVAMRDYSHREIESYVASGEPFDKAGGFAVQDDVFRPARSVRGCYTNVLGLPLCEVGALLGDLGADVELSDGWGPPEQCTECKIQPRGER